MTVEFLSTLRGLTYLAAGMLFILSLRGLSTQESARRGNLLGTIGMGMAVLVTALVFLASVVGADSTAGPVAGAPPTMAMGLLGAALIGGAAVGALLASRARSRPIARSTWSRSTSASSSARSPSAGRSSRSRSCAASWGAAR